jgi:hypothetical protein
MKIYCGHIHEDLPVAIFMNIDCGHIHEDLPVATFMQIYLWQYL